MLSAQDIATEASKRFDAKFPGAWRVTPRHYAQERFNQEYVKAADTARRLIADGIMTEEQANAEMVARAYELLVFEHSLFNSYAGKK